MDCCKLDKIDKIFISILCIFVTFTCIFSTFCFASQKIEPIVINELKFDGISSTFQDFEGQAVLAYPLTIGHKYQITNNSAYNRTMRYSSELPSTGVTVLSQITINSGETVDIIAQQNYLFINDGTSISGVETVKNALNIQDLTVGFDLAITDLVHNVGVNIWDSFNNLLPYILVVVTVSLGFYFILHAIREVSKGRDI